MFNEVVYNIKMEKNDQDKLFKTKSKINKQLNKIPKNNQLNKYLNKNNTNKDTLCLIR